MYDRKPAAGGALYAAKEIELKSTGTSLDERTKKKHDRCKPRDGVTVLHAVMGIAFIVVCVVMGIAFIVVCVVMGIAFIVVCVVMGIAFIVVCVAAVARAAIA